MKNGIPAPWWLQRALNSSSVPCGCRMGLQKSRHVHPHCPRGQRCVKDLPTCPLHIVPHCQYFPRSDLKEFVKNGSIKLSINTSNNALMTVWTMDIDPEKLQRRITGELFRHRRIIRLVLKDCLPFHFLMGAT